MPTSKTAKKLKPLPRKVTGRDIDLIILKFLTFSCVESRRQAFSLEVKVDTNKELGKRKKEDLGKVVEEGD